MKMTLGTDKYFSSEITKKKEAKLSLPDKLASSTVDETVFHFALRRLMDILKNESDGSQFNKLSKNSRTLLSTPKVINILL